MAPTPSTLGELLQRSSASFPDHTALGMVGGPSLTYRMLQERVDTLAALLRERGIVHGDRVAVIGENMPNWGVAFFAITSLGAVAVPVLIDFPVPVIHHILRHAECSAAVVSRRLLPKVEELESHSCPTLIIMDDLSLQERAGGGDTVSRILRQGRGEFQRMRGAALRAAGRTPVSVAEGDLASIIYTSGTTGHSKGVMLTHRNILADAVATASIVSVTAADRLLSILPLAHTYECTIGLVTPMLLGASVMYLDRPPTAAVLVPALSAVKPTVLLSVPLVIEKIYKNRVQPRLQGTALMRGLNRISPIRRSLHRAAGKKLLQVFGGELRILAIGGAALAPDVEQFLREARFPYAIGYGLTETAPMVAGTPPERTRFRSTGPALPGTEIEIRDADPATGEGEIFIRGPMVMKGYFKDPEKTAAVLDEQGWFRTGDLGTLDADGYLYIKGRLKNMILGPSGKNIYPEEIEGIINEQDVVLESLVYEEQGRLVARIYLDYEKLDRMFSASSLSEPEVRNSIRTLLDDLRSTLNTRLPPHSRIQRIVEQPEPFEKTPTQKIKRHLYVS
jgi:long-chain acyl-CoA synthetase